MSEEKQLRRISTPTALDRQAASSARLESGKFFCYCDIEILVARGLDGEPEIQLNFKAEFATAERKRNRLNIPAFQLGFQAFGPVPVILGIALVDRAFKDFHTIDEICGFTPPLNGDAQILEWADPMRVLPTVFVDILNALQQQPSISSSSPITPIQYSQCNVQHNTGTRSRLVRHTEDVFLLHYMSQNAGQPTSSEENQLILADVASLSPSGAAIRSSENGTPTHAQMAGSISVEASLAKMAFRPLLTALSLPAYRRLTILQRPSITHLSTASTLATDRKACDNIRNDRYECIECHDLVGQEARLWRCEACRSILHFFCAKWSYICDNGWNCPGCNLRPDKQPEPKCVCEYEEELCSTSMPTALSEKAASSARPGSGRELCYGDIALLVARGPDSKPDVRLHYVKGDVEKDVEREFAKEEHNSAKWLAIPQFRSIVDSPSFDPVMVILHMTLLKKEFKNFDSYRQIYDKGLQLKDGGQYFLRWANPLQALPEIFITLINLLRQRTVPPTLEIPPQGSPASEDNSTIPTFPRIAAPISPCLTASALADEGSQALDFSRPIHELITKGRYECLICERYVRPVSHIWSCQICRVVLHLSCTEEWAAANLSVEGWPCPSCKLAQLRPPNYICWCGKQEKPLARPGLPPHSCGRACSRVSVELASPGKSCCDRPCEFMCHTGRCPPCGYEEPLQGISSQSSKDKARHPRSKRTREEMDESITHDDDSDSAADDNDQPLLKKHNRGMILHINSLIEKTKSELEKADEEHCRLRKARMRTSEAFWALNRLKRRHSGLVDVRQYILDREKDPTASGLCDTPLLAIDGRIREIEEEIEKVKGEFDRMHKGGELDNQPEGLHRLSLLELRHKALMEARRYILGRLVSSDSSPAWIQQDS